MKKLALPILFVLAFSANVFALNAWPRNIENDLSKQVEAAIQKADKDAKTKKPVCVHCEEEIISNGQHCAGKSFTGLCSPTQEVAPQKVVAEYSCDHCGTPPSAETKAEPKKAVKKCASCGEEILSNGQHCSANSYNNLCNETKEKAPKPVVIESECDHCGGNHSPVAQTTKKASLGHCDNCAREITKEGQMCEERGNLLPCVKSDKNYKTWHGEKGLPENHKPSVNNEKNVQWKAEDTGLCPDCGRTEAQIKISGHNHK